ncbi:uncharacterized protein AB675_9627 [Cyphellophora attinorum]|uniref:Serine hydrolase domain-containing protein n=1 Tax=Cyphellophora attinorum TaxID=1664694 RepID=A0A0N1HWW7_9EURO|nr:uncharacterized protein AB675_9627 [Phialophora attinorum]KPI42274.1 hypothetical protein AB675_9627 [Phialophora attinorum]
MPPSTPHPAQTPKRVLMLHGFGQNACLFRRKTAALTTRLRRLLANHYQVPATLIEFIYPDAPFLLLPHEPSSPHTEAASIDAHSGPTTETGFRAWWRNLDTVSHYPGLVESLRYLKELVGLYGPFVGAVGFSQGAALGGIFTSWCEGVPCREMVAAREARSGSGRREVVEELCDVLSERPQDRELEFVVCFSGYAGTRRLYGGFYDRVEGRLDGGLRTASVHVLGRYDTMVTWGQTMELVCAFEGGAGEGRREVVEHCGVHFVPSEGVVLEKVIEALGRVLVGLGERGSGCFGDLVGVELGAHAEGRWPGGKSERTESAEHAIQSPAVQIGSLGAELSVPDTGSERRMCVATKSRKNRGRRCQRRNGAARVAGWRMLASRQAVR